MLEAAAPSPATLSAAGLSPELTKMALSGSIQRGFGSGRIYASCVIHLCTQVGETELGMACAVAVAGLRGGARQRTRIRAMPGSVWGANGTASTREVRHIYWGSLQGLRHSEARARHGAAALRGTRHGGAAWQWNAGVWHSCLRCARLA